MRTSLALTLSAGLLLSLAACSSAPAAPDCSAAAAPGGSSSLVSTTGDLGSDPQATFPSPLVPSSVERSVLLGGDSDGTEVGLGSTVNVSYTVYDGETGAPVGAPQGGLIVAGESLPGGLLSGLLCSTAGERVAIALPNEEATQVVSGAPGSLVMVFDVLDVYPSAAAGTLQAPTSGLPGVVRTADGRPGLQVTGESPTEAKSATLIEGDGDDVVEGDSVLVQVLSVSYDAPTRAASSTWADGTPQLWLMSDDAAQTSGSKQPAGITPYLVGQPVGSQVVVVLPAAAEGGAATAYVVDILGVVPAA
ncbi:MAG: hypothetical protein Q7T71_11025 [Herbiconiux sp.]|nr:hypothetical protein [Herbiconiux sp.]